MSSTSPSNSSAKLHSVLRLGLFVIGVLLAASYILPSFWHAQKSLGTYGVVPPFSLVERSGRTITNQDLAGKIYVADFIFTMCPGPCPVLSANMAKLQEKLKEDDRVRLVSFSVDPQDDTPAVLATYAKHLGADPKKWWFLTGPEQEVYDLIQKGFLQTVQDNHGKELEPGQFLVTHSTYLVLVDGEGRMRGFFNGLDGDSRSKILEGIRQLENE